MIDLSSIPEMTTLKGTSIAEHWDVTKYKSGKAAGRARRQQNRRKRLREQAELTHNDSKMPQNKKQKEAMSTSTGSDGMEMILRKMRP